MRSKNRVGQLRLPLEIPVQLSFEPNEIKLPVMKCELETLLCSRQRESQADVRVAIVATE